MSSFGDYLVPCVICLTIIYALLKKTDVYSAFTDGVIAGTISVSKIFPALFALFIAVNVFRASGLVEYISKLLSPLCKTLNFPSELIPFALLRPISGSGSLALASDLFDKFGPDSEIGRVASVMMGSTETTFYTVAVYFGAAKTKDIRHSLKCGLAADAFSMIMSLIFCSWYF